MSRPHKPDPETAADVRDDCDGLAFTRRYKVPWLAKRGECPSCDRRREAGIAANKAARQRRAKERAE